MDTKLDDLVARCLESLEDGDAQAVDRICAENPDLAEEIRACLNSLEGHGMLERGEIADLPERIGPYRLLEEIGRGGMGTVYLAEQREPVPRRVALKVVKFGMDSREALARFERERRTLARMQHPHIATVLDAGVDTRQRPYFVMEHVPGIPITDYCDRHALSTEDRLRLFIPVCEAVQHAHHKGVVHRDLKPSNILVMLQDGSPVPKIIDFGVAKTLYLEAEEDGALHTQHGDIVGTIEYMSPEQAGHDHLDVDSRTDVYSLGVILYQLLTGVLPFDSKRLRTHGLEAQRILRDEEPPVPSTRVSALGAESTNAAERRRSDVTRLARRLRGDLDWIVLKALEKDRTRRYAAPLELAADLRCHLSDEPVSAGAPSRWYRLRKYVRRHRAQAFSVGAVALALVGGLVASLLFYFDARASARSAEAARVEESVARGHAEANYVLAREAVDKMLTRVGDESLADVPQMEDVRRELLEEALRFYEGFARDRGDDVELRLAAADARARVAGIYRMLGHTAEADAAFGAALQQFEALVDGPSRLGAKRGLAQTRLRHASLQSLLGRRTEAEASLRAALAGFDALVAETAAVADELGQARAHNELGKLRHRDRPSQALVDFERAVEIDERVHAAEPGGVARRQLALHLADLGDHLGAFGRQKDAEEAHLRAKTHVEAMVRDDPDDRFLRSTLARTCGQLGVTYSAQRRGPQARELLEASAKMWEELVRDFPGIPSYRSSLAAARGNFANAAYELGDLPAARASYLEAVAVKESLIEDFPDVPVYRGSLATTLGSLGRAYLDVYFKSKRTDQLSEAEPYIRRAIDILTRLHDEFPERVDHHHALAQQTANLATVLRVTGRVQDAEPIYERSLQVFTELAQRYPEVPKYQQDLAGSCENMGALLYTLDRYEEARVFLNRAENLLRDAQARDIEDDSYGYYLRDLLLTRVRAELGAEDHAKAAAILRKMVVEYDEHHLVHDRAAELLLRCVELARGAGAEAGVVTGYLADAEVASHRALELYDAMRDRYPTMREVLIMRASARLRLARICEEKSSFAEARAALEAAIADVNEAGDGQAHGRFDDRLREAYAALFDHLLARGDVAEVATRAAELAGRVRVGAVDLFVAARALARCAALDGGADQAANAVQLLTRAIDAGYGDVAGLRDDPQWKALHGRDDFERAVGR